VFGLLLGLVAFPPLRFTLLSQLQFALTDHSPLWMPVPDQRRSLLAQRRLDAVAALYADDYLLQVGRATARFHDETLRLRPAVLPAADYAPGERALVELGTIAREFPTSTGAYAHLARYMMADRVRIQRAELSPANPEQPDADKETRSAPARRTDTRLMEWALRFGEIRDPDNAFWPALLAATYFAAQRDQAALAALSRAKRKKQWHAYLYEEVLGQWRLYAAAYGDNGAAQQVAPLSLLAFPHAREIRRAAEMARWHSERLAAAGQIGEAARIRRDIAWLGLLMRDKAQWAYEALLGTDLILLAGTQSEVRLTPNTIRTVADWEREARPYIALLKRERRQAELAWLRHEVEQSCALRQRLDLARSDASYPGIPPGIPLVALFGNWIAGVCLLQQILLLSLAALLSAFGPRLFAPLSRRPHEARMIGLVALLSLTGGSAVLLCTGNTGLRQTILLCIGLTLLALFAAETFPSPAGRSSGKQDLPWTNRDTLRLLGGLLLPTLAALYFLRPFLSSLHPIAQLLTGLTGNGRSLTLWGAFWPALAAVSVPMLLSLLGGFRAWHRGISPLYGAGRMLRRTTLPLMAGLLLAYLLLLTRTFQLDAAASRAINEAAGNELQWVLTRRAPGSELADRLASPE
jgi:hypothetical protein